MERESAKTDGHKQSETDSPKSAKTSEKCKNGRNKRKQVKKCKNARGACCWSFSGHFPVAIKRWPSRVSLTVWLADPNRPKWAPSGQNGPNGPKWTSLVHFALANAHRVLQGAAQRGAQFYFIFAVLRSLFFRTANRAFSTLKLAPP